MSILINTRHCHVNFVVRINLEISIIYFAKTYRILDTNFVSFQYKIHSFIKILSHLTTNSLLLLCYIYNK